VILCTPCNVDSGFKADEENMKRTSRLAIRNTHFFNPKKEPLQYLHYKGMVRSGSIIITFDLRAFGVKINGRI